MLKPNNSVVKVYNIHSDYIEGGPFMKEENRKKEKLFLVWLGEKKYTPNYFEV